MALPRLNSSANPLSVTIDINENLRPYFEIWFQKEKLSGETPAEFGLRILRKAAKSDHIASNIDAETNAADAAREQASTDIDADIDAFNAEI